MKVLKCIYHDQRGQSMLMVISFMALAIPLITSTLALGGSLSIDSQVKSRIVKSQYSAVGCRERAISRLANETGYANGLEVGVPDVWDPMTLNGGSCTVTVTKGSTVSGGELLYADVVLVLDNSSSIDNDELVYLKDAANTIVDEFNLSATSGRMRIGVSRFRGSSASVVGMTDLDHHAEYEPLHGGINGLVQGAPDLGEGTNIVAGLAGAAAQFNTGLGDRIDPPYNVPNLLIFITDGDDTHGNDTEDIADASALTGAEVFAVGVGGDVNLSTLNAIASEPDTSHVFTAASFDTLFTVIDPVIEAANDASLTGTTFSVEAEMPDGSINESQIIITPDGKVVTPP